MVRAQESKVVIIGANGMLSHALRTVFPRALLFDNTISPQSGISHLDITSERDIEAVLGNLPRGSYIINAAAYTDVDGAETERGRVISQAVNADGPGNLVNLARQGNHRLVHYSTAYVFDGTRGDARPRGYVEDDKQNPLNNYGHDKLTSESWVLSGRNNQVGLVLRLDNLYGQNGPTNFVHKAVKLAQERQGIVVVNDQAGSPTSTTTVANITYQLVELWRQGTELEGQVLHVTSKNGCSRADLARKIIEILDLGCNVEEISTQEHRRRITESQPERRIARRPEDCRLSTQKLADLGIETPRWEDDLETYLRGAFMGEETPLLGQSTS